MRIEQLTFTRFLAAVSIVIFHYGGKSFLFNNDYVGFIFGKADVCVSYFFILSGFVMMIAYANRSAILAREYLMNRLARIYPLYFLAIFIFLLFQIRCHQIDYSGLFYNVFMVQSWIPSKVLSVNPPGWSLSVEFVFYAIFPFVFNRLYKRIKLGKIIFGIVLFWIFSQIIFQLFYFSFSKEEFPLVKDFIMYNSLFHINEFLIGTLAGFLFTEKMQFKKGNYDFLILLFVGLVLLALKFPVGLNFHNGLLAVFFIPLIILISLNNGLISTLFQKPLFVFLGEISFGIYILQHPIYFIISAYSINKYFQISDVTIVFFIRLVILLVVSSLAYIYIEKPIQNKIKRVVKRVGITIYSTK